MTSPSTERAKLSIAQKANGILGTFIFRLLTTVLLAILVGVGYLLKVEGETLLGDVISKNKVFLAAIADASAAKEAAEDARSAVLGAQAAATLANQKADEMIKAQERIFQAIKTSSDRQESIVTTLATINEHNVAVEQRLTRIEAKQDAAH